MSFLQRLFGRGDRRKACEPLYRTIVALARDPAWYRDGQVPDTIDGRFDMVAAVTALALLRLEAEGEAAREASALLTEAFVADMDARTARGGDTDILIFPFAPHPNGRRSHWRPFAIVRNRWCIHFVGFTVYPVR